MAKNIIGRGAEAIIYQINNKIVKDRISKSYRHPELDRKIIKRRTKSEAKIINKLQKIIPVPKLLADPGQGRMIHMELIQGQKLSEHLDTLKNKEKICEKIGENIAKLHDNDIIHGDLTTSNMILSENKVYFIDFGLGFTSKRIEDKAVDLHLLRQALESKHYDIWEKCFEAALKGYKQSYPEHNLVLNRLEKVEARGRNKSKF